jgi:hypothetical protein
MFSERLARCLIAPGILLAAALLLSSCAGGGSGAEPKSSAGTANRVYRSSDFGFHFSYPAGLRAHDFHRDYTMVSFRGAVVTNEAAGRNFVDAYAGALSKLPPRSAVLSIRHTDGGPMPWLEEREAHFPLRASSFAPVRHVTIPRGASWRERGFAANGWNLVADVYFAPLASQSDRVAIWRVVSSLRFRALRSGQRTGEGRFLVLKEKDDYPIGSVDRMSANEFLVRAPHGFYGLGGMAMSMPSKFPCAIRFERTKFEFACGNGSKRWDRMGRPLWKGASNRDFLGVLPAVKVGQDGHVLFSANESAFGWRPLERQLWGNSAR